jgi:deoxyribodipyrimidine photolyase-related protein
MPTLRLILGDQLNPNHSWFARPERGVHYVMMEVRQETDYVLHHAQKIIAIFAAMRRFAETLKKAKHRVHYLSIDDTKNEHSVPANIDALIKDLSIDRFEYQMPDEWRLDHQLAEYAKALPIETSMIDTEHFYTARDETARYFDEHGHKQWLMEHFYRHMRKQHGVLMETEDRPAGGQWNFDHENRKSWNGEPPAPEDLRGKPHDHAKLWRTITGAGVKSFGAPHESEIHWPLDRAEALTQLKHFIDRALPNFGAWQDAMSAHEPRLFHSLLSFALNTKMLNPREVVDAAEEAYRAHKADLAAVEGFIRQIIGWREYIRGVYWANMPRYAQKNVFKHKRTLPQWFWTGETNMRCLKHAIGQSLDEAHAHHIQRLMIIGNFALLAGLSVQETCEWYLGVYVDAFEWVELPNTLGMSQFADGGLMASKPYVSSAAYIDRMSDYCKGCAYDKKKRTEDDACPFNALYWDFFARNEATLGRNHRLGMMYRQLEKMPETERAAIASRARKLKASLDEL